MTRSQPRRPFREQQNRESAEVTVAGALEENHDVRDGKGRCHEQHSSDNEASEVGVAAKQVEAAQRLGQCVSSPFRSSGYLRHAAEDDGGEQP